MASDGTQGNGDSTRPSISADGRYVAFESLASNLVPGDTNGRNDVFVHDRLTGQTTRVSRASDGTQGNDNSFLSLQSSISADGRYVAFFSDASDLVTGDTNGASDIFVHDRLARRTTRVSLASDGTQGNNNSSLPSISADGRHVAFGSYASNLVPDDANGNYEVFAYDRLTAQTELVSVASDGVPANDTSAVPSLSADGRYVAFDSRASNLAPGNIYWQSWIFLRDRLTGQTELVSVASDGTQGNDDSYAPSISADGRYVAFQSRASNLVPGDTNGYDDIFMHDRLTGQTTRASLASDGAQGNNRSVQPATGADGRYVAFYSDAANLVPGDTNGQGDIFVHDRSLTCDISYATSSPTTDDMITFYSSAADDDGVEASVDWEFGDGATMSGDPVSHQYTMPGTYAVTVTVCDDDGYCTECAASVTIWCSCDVAIDQTHCKMPAAGHIGQCKTGRIAARNTSLTESCDVVLRVTDNAGNVVFETVETIGPGRRVALRFDHCFTRDEIGRHWWAWEVWPVLCAERTRSDNTWRRRVNVHR